MNDESMKGRIATKRMGNVQRSTFHVQRSRGESTASPLVIRHSSFVIPPTLSTLGSRPSTQRATDSAICNLQSAFPRRGFTLIEMLVVIGVIGILAALVVSLGPLASRHRIDRRAKAELQQLITAIEAYKAKKGFYPPSNRDDETRPPLYYELKGTRKSGNRYITLDGASSIVDDGVQIPDAYGVGGFVNSTTDVADPDRPPAEDFHTGLKLSQTGTLDSSNFVYLGIPFQGPDGSFSRWRYYTFETNSMPVSKVPKRNKEGYDLWIQLKSGGKTNTYGNWK